jgi:hypothetical protein
MPSEKAISSGFSANSLSFAKMESNRKKPFARFPKKTGLKLLLSIRILDYSGPANIAEGLFPPPGTGR